MYERRQKKYTPSYTLAGNLVCRRASAEGGAEVARRAPA
jgi:hypothetical protein